MDTWFALLFEDGSTSPWCSDRIWVDSIGYRLKFFMRGKVTAIIRARRRVRLVSGPPPIKPFLSLIVRSPGYSK